MSVIDSFSNSVPYPWESVAGSLSYKKLWFLGRKHTTPKYSQNKIWAVKNSGNNVRTSVFGALQYPGDNVIVVSNRGLKTGENSRKVGEFRKEMSDIN